MNKTLKSFVEYYEKNPHQRFWQALANWSGHNFIYVSQKNVAHETQNNDLIDTWYLDEIFHEEGK